MNQSTGSIGDCLSSVKKGKVYRINNRCLPSKGRSEEISDVLKKSCSVEPYLQVEQFQRDLKIKFCTGASNGSKDKTKPRGEINHFSKRSSKRCKFALRNSIHLTRAIICLTYPADYPEDGREFKKHFDTFGKRLNRRGLLWFSVMEFQERGAPHFHILVTGIIDRHELSRMWFDIVGSRDPRHLQAGTSIQLIVDDNDDSLNLTECVIVKCCVKGIGTSSECLSVKPRLRAI